MRDCENKNSTLKIHHMRGVQLLKKFTLKYPWYSLAMPWIFEYFFADSIHVVDFLFSDNARTNNIDFEWHLRFLRYFYDSVIYILMVVWIAPSIKIKNYSSFLGKFRRFKMTKFFWKKSRPNGIEKRRKWRKELR